MLFLSTMGIWHGSDGGSMKRDPPYDGPNPRGATLRADPIPGKKKTGNQKGRDCRRAHTEERVGYAANSSSLNAIRDALPAITSASRPSVSVRVRVM